MTAEKKYLYTDNLMPQTAKNFRGCATRLFLHMLNLVMNDKEHYL